MKKIIALLLALVMVLALCACTPKDPNVGPASNPGTETTPGTQESKPPVEPSPAGKPYDGVTINFWSMWSDGEPQAEVIKECAAAFEEETGCKVKIEWKGRGINELLSAALDAEEAIDIFEDDYNRIGQVYAQWTADLTDMAAAAGYADKSYKVFNDQSIAWTAKPATEGSEEVPGFLNAITEQPQIGGVFYNKDLFDQAGITDVPATPTWQQFMDMSAKLKEAGIAPLAQDAAYTNFNTYYMLVRCMGEAAIAEMGKAGNWAGNEKAVQAFQNIIDYINAGYLVDGAPDEYPASQNKIGFGTAAMGICAQYLTSEVDAMLEESGAEGVNWGFFAYPTVDGGADPTATYIGANSLAISAYSENKQAAFDFCMKLVTGEFDQKMADTARQIPADPHNTCATLPGAVETLSAATSSMSWCGSLNTLDQWGAIKTFFTELFEGKYATGADAAAAVDALY